MKVSSRDINSLLQRPRDSFFAFLLHGPDAGLIDERAQTLAHTFSSNLEDPFSVSKLTGKDVLTDPALLADALNSMTLTGALRVVLLSGTASELSSAVKTNINHLNTNCRLIISAKDSTSKHSLVTLCDKTPNIASIACYPDENEQLQKFVRDNLSKHNINVSKEMIYYISQKLGVDRAINRSEIEKLVLYATKTKTIDRQEIDILLGDNTSQLIDKLVSSILNGETKQLASLLEKAKADNVQPIVIIRSFQSYLRTLVSVGASKKSGLSTEVAINNVRPPIYFKRKQLVKHHCNIYSVEWCLALTNRFMLLEKQCKKSSYPDPYSLVGQSLLGIAISLSRQRT
tara:strand:- start:531 stop:1562 length:1032 start_codon:yes stop_codon:yes gene_type:complete